MVQSGFFYDPGCASITEWTKTFQGADAQAVANGGNLQFVVQWNNQPFAIDWSKVTDVLPYVDATILDGDGQKGVVKNAVEHPLRVKLVSHDPSLRIPTDAGLTAFSVKTAGPVD